MNKNTLSVSDLARMGGKARWAGIDERSRSKKMQEIAMLPRKKKKKVCHNKPAR
jgi:hypothetical protein